jgi:hypothetical protein
MTNIRLPAQLAGFAGGRREFSFEANTLSEIFDQFDQIAPMIRSQVFDGADTIRQFVGLFVNGKQVIETGDSWKGLECGGELTIVMSVAGG